jgi:hypothetical protein
VRAPNLICSIPAAGGDQGLEGQHGHPEQRQCTSQSIWKRNSEGSNWPKVSRQRQRREDSFAPEARNAIRSRLAPFSHSTSPLSDHIQLSCNTIQSFTITDSKTITRSTIDFMRELRPAGAIIVSAFQRNMISPFWMNRISLTLNDKYTSLYRPHTFIAFSASQSLHSTLPALPFPAATLHLVSNPNKRRECLCLHIRIPLIRLMCLGRCIMRRSRKTERPHLRLDIQRLQNPSFLQHLDIA